MKLRELIAKILAPFFRLWRRFFGGSGLEGRKIVLGGEEREIVKYDGGAIWVDRPWTRAPDAGDSFEVET